MQRSRTNQPFLLRYWWIAIITSMIILLADAGVTAALAIQENPSTKVETVNVHMMPGQQQGLTLGVGSYNKTVWDHEPSDTLKSAYGLLSPLTLLFFGTIFAGIGIKYHYTRRIGDDDEPLISP